ncbi:MAG: hypothetical protein ACKO37_01605 [Vampirovibrionales bacterium]
MMMMAGESINLSQRLLGKPAMVPSQKGISKTTTQQTVQQTQLGKAPVAKALPNKVKTTQTTATQTPSTKNPALNTLLVGSGVGSAVIANSNTQPKNAKPSQETPQNSGKSTPVAKTLDQKLGRTPAEESRALETRVIARPNKDRAKDLQVQVRTNNGTLATVQMDSTTEEGGKVENIQAEVVRTNRVKEVERKLPGLKLDFNYIGDYIKPSYWAGVFENIQRNGFNLKETVVREKKVEQVDTLRIRQKLNREGTQYKVVTFAGDNPKSKVASVEMYDTTQGSNPTSRQINLLNDKQPVKVSREEAKPQAQVEEEMYQHLKMQAEATKQSIPEAQLRGMAKQRAEAEIKLVRQNLAMERDTALLATNVQQLREEAQKQGKTLDDATLIETLKGQSLQNDPLTRHTVFKRNMKDGKTSTQEYRIAYNAMTFDEKTGDLALRIRPVDTQGRIENTVENLSLGGLSSVMDGIKTTYGNEAQNGIATPYKRLEPSLQELTQRLEAATKLQIEMNNTLAKATTEDERKKLMQSEAYQKSQATLRTTLSGLTEEQIGILSNLATRTQPGGVLGLGDPDSKTFGSSLSFEDHLQYASRGMVDTPSLKQVGNAKEVVNQGTLQAQNIQDVTDLRGKNLQDASPVALGEELRKLEDATSETRSFQSKIGEAVGGNARKVWNWFQGKGFTNEWDVSRQRAEITETRQRFEQAKTQYDALLTQAAQATTDEQKMALEPLLNDAKTALDRERLKAYTVRDQVQNFEKESKETGKLITSEVVSKGAFALGTLLASPLGPLAPGVGVAAAALMNTTVNWAMNKDTARGYSGSEAAWDALAGAVSAAPLPSGVMNRFFKPVVDNPGTRMLMNRMGSLPGVRQLTHLGEAAFIRTLGKDGVRQVGNFLARELPQDLAQNISTKMAVRRNQTPDEDFHEGFTNTIFDEFGNTIVSAATMGVARKVGGHLVVNPLKQAGVSVAKSTGILSKHHITGELVQEAPLFARVFNRTNRQHHEGILNHLETRFGTRDLARLTEEQRLGGMAEYLQHQGLGATRQTNLLDRSARFGGQSNVAQSRVEQTVLGHLGNNKAGFTPGLGFGANQRSGLLGLGASGEQQAERYLSKEFFPELRQQVNTLLHHNPKAYANTIPGSVKKVIDFDDYARYGFANRTEAERAMGAIYSTMTLDEREALKATLIAHRRAGHAHHMGDTMKINLAEFTSSVYQSKAQGGIAGGVPRGWGLDGLSSMGDAKETFLHRGVQGFGNTFKFQSGFVPGWTMVGMARNNLFNGAWYKFGPGAGTLKLIRGLEEAGLDKASVRQLEATFMSLPGAEQGMMLQHLMREAQERIERGQRLDNSLVQQTLARTSAQTNNWNVVPNEPFALGDRLGHIEKQLNNIKHGNYDLNEWASVGRQIDQLKAERADLQKAMRYLDGNATAENNVRYHRDAQGNTSVNVKPDFAKMAQQPNKLYAELNKMGRRRWTGEDMAHIVRLNQATDGITGQEVIQTYLDTAFKNNRRPFETPEATLQRIRDTVREQFSATLVSDGKVSEARLIDQWIRQWQPTSLEKPNFMWGVGRFIQNAYGLERPNMYVQDRELLRNAGFAQ